MTASDILGRKPSNKKQLLARTTQIIKLALISDLHFGIYSRTKEFAVEGEDIIDETSGGISLKQGLIDVLKKEQTAYILVAGDLTSTGSPHEYTLCQIALDDIASEVGIRKENVVLSVGNHDIDWKITRMAHDTYSKYTAPFPVDSVKEKYQIIAANVGALCILSF
jgi:metallophosphoesterase superfamily enzyme